VGALRAGVLTSGLLALLCGTSLSIGQPAPATPRPQPTPAKPLTPDELKAQQGEQAPPITAPAVPGRPATQLMPSPAGGAAPRQPGAAPVAQPVNQPGAAQPRPVGGQLGAQPGAAPGFDQPALIPIDDRGGQVGGQGGAPGGMLGGAFDPPAEGEAEGDMVTLAAFSEPVQLSALITLLAETLTINITIIGDLQGSVAFNAPVPVRKDELLNLVDSLLNQQGWTITQDRTGWYTVVQEDKVQVNFAGDRATTRVFSTPNIRPSAIQNALASQLGGGAGGQPGMGGGAGGPKLQFIDELGIIIATASTRQLDTIDSLIGKIMSEYARAKFIRFELVNVAAPAARDRILSLIGQSPRTGMGGAEGGQPGMGGVRQPGTGGGTLDNIGDRLTVDAQGNALIFRGVQEEIDQVRTILAMIDVQNTLVPKRYYAGTYAAQIANLARSYGLGEVTSISREDQMGGGGQFQQGGRGGFQPGMPGQQAQQGFVGGPVMVVNESDGTIIYYGTEAQQSQLDRLIQELDTQSERIVIREYRLKNSKAEDVAEVIMGLLNNQSIVGDSPLMPDGGGFGFGSQGGTSSRFRNAGMRTTLQQNNPQNPQGGSGGEMELDGANAFVIADIKNNQVLVKAPAGQQKDFSRLIEKLDLRRPQVYLETKLIAVSWSDELRLAFETQLINANGSGGALQTNFGLTTAGASFTDARSVVPNLAGFTAAIIKSEYIPIVINALQTKADARILSTPALLVDDNEEARIVSVEEQPYSTTQVSAGSPNVTSLGGYVEAGTTLTIKPNISDDGYLRLKYETELSSFTGAAQPGLPPPKQTNNISSDSITVPADTTVIVGGINIDTNRKTRVQVPLLGEIPLIGYLFRDTNNVHRVTTLYVFITPRILREPNFADLRLLTAGPQQRALEEGDFPPLRPTGIDIVPSMALPPPSEDDELLTQPASHGR
jgi:type II secretory pathway component GspD/PulD (secretin)